MTLEEARLFTKQALDTLDMTHQNCAACRQDLVDRLNDEFPSFQWNVDKDLCVHTSDKNSPESLSVDLVTHLHRQRAFSMNTFGPGARTAGIVDHIRRELLEIEAAPLDLKEWIDVVLLALDGAWRTGATVGQVAQALLDKQDRNMARKWPDWRTSAPDKAIEHVREEG